MARQTRKADVIDFQRYRAARAASQQLPLFDGDAAPRLRTLPAVRALSDREIAHRERMLLHLRAARR